MKSNLLVSFSGGETSAFMAAWLWEHKKNDFNMVFVFANTGQENQETLNFIRQCSNYFKFPVVYLEALVSIENGQGTTYKEVNYFNVNMDGRPFEDMIKKYGIPNVSTPQCTRELKQRPIEKYAKNLFKGEYYTAIGIRIDEIDRMNKKKDELRLIYPLISMQPMSKPMINLFWSQQPFRLTLKGYEGNCKTCWKKSNNKLYQIAKEKPEVFNFFAKMEDRYGNYTPETRLKLMVSRGEAPKLPVTFFRGNRSVQDILNESKGIFKQPSDDSLNFDLIGGESCEVFSECKDS